MKLFKKVLMIGGIMVTLVAGSKVQAQTNAFDAAAVVTSATGTFNLVIPLAITILGATIAIRLVRKFAK